MTPSISAVVRSAGERDLLARTLRPLVEQLEARARGDEVIVVDDSTDGSIAAWIAEQHPPAATFDSVQVEVRCIARPKPGGAARAWNAGVEAAAHPLVLLLRPGARPHARAIEALVEALDDPHVAGAVPRVNAGDETEKARVLWHDGAGRLDVLGAEDDANEEAPRLASSAALLVRRDAFLECSGFDPLFAPELGAAEADLALQLRRRGGILRDVPSAQVDFDAEIARSPAHETRSLLAGRDAWLLAWKHIEEGERARGHCDRLEARALDALLAGDDGFLRPLALALEDLSALLKSRERIARAAGGGSAARS